MLAAAKRLLGVAAHGAVDPAAGARGRFCPPALARRAHACIDLIDVVARIGLVVLFIGELGAILVEIFRREVFDQSFLWLEEVSQIILLATAFIGGPLAYRAHSHAAVQVITRTLKPRLRGTVEAATDILILGIGVLTFRSSLGLFQVDSLSVLPMTQWNLGMTVVPFIVGMGLVVLFALERLLLRHAPAAALRGCVAVVVLVGLALAFSWVPALRPGNGAALLLMLTVFFGMILLGLPVTFAMLAGTMLYLSLTDLAPGVAAAQNTIDGAGMFVLLTIPFFIWAGLVMERGGISLRIVRFAMAMVGHLRGGLLQVVVMTTFLVAGVSGSKLADVVAVGSIMREQLARRGYRAEEGAGVLAAATALSETIPPSIAMLVLGSVVPVSIGAMFVAGILPAATLAAILMVLVWVLAGRGAAETEEKASWPARRRAALGALLPAAMPAILIIGIKGGFATPTEVSSVAVAYGLVLAVLVYRQIGWRSFISIISEAAVMSGMVLFMIAAAGSFAWVLSAGNMPHYLLGLLHAAGDNRYAFLAGTILIVIVVGSLLEGIPSLIILAPVLYPVAIHLGIDGVHFALMLVLAMGVGIFVPPIGIGFFVSSSVMQASVEATSKAIIPYMLILLGGILMLAYVPWFSTVALDLFGR